MNGGFKNEMLISFEKLVEKLENKAINVDVVKKAFNLVCIVYRKQLETSNKPSILHSLEVVKIVANFNMDTHSIVTAFLHDTTVNDSDIRDNFGREIAGILKEITELNKIENDTPFLDNKEEIEKYQKSLYITSGNIRVWVVKFANRLYKMQRLNQISDLTERKRVAETTIVIYAELAARMGLRYFKEELQALAFAGLCPEENKRIKTQVEELKGKNKNLVKEIEDDLKNILLSSNLDYIEISGREKKPFSIWHKIHNRDIPFKDMTDIFAFRVIVKNVEHCYKALGIIHSNYCVIDGGFKDYIDDPKKNVYQSLHNIVIVSKGHKIEIQIRTEKMHEVAELGDAAHWQYKKG